MPANWDLCQHLSAAGQVEWPTGPIKGVPAGFDPEWVEAWVVQGGDVRPNRMLPGPSQSTAGAAAAGLAVAGRWTAPDPHWRNGRFDVGPPVGPPAFALGISLLALRNNAAGTHEFDWWFEVVYLHH